MAWFASRRNNRVPRRDRAKNQPLFANNASRVVYNWIHPRNQAPPQNVLVTHSQPKIKLVNKPRPNRQNPLPPPQQLVEVVDPISRSPINYVNGIVTDPRQFGFAGSVSGHPIPALKSIRREPKDQLVKLNPDGLAFLACMANPMGDNTPDSPLGQNALVPDGNGRRAIKVSCSGSGTFSSATSASGFVVMTGYNTGSDAQCMIVYGADVNVGTTLQTTTAIIPCKQSASLATFFAYGAGARRTGVGVKVRNIGSPDSSTGIWSNYFAEYYPKWGTGAAEYQPNSIYLNHPGGAKRIYGATDEEGKRVIGMEATATYDDVAKEGGVPGPYTYGTARTIWGYLPVIKFESLSGTMEVTWTFHYNIYVDGDAFPMRSGTAYETDFGDLVHFINSKVPHGISSESFPNIIKAILAFLVRNRKALGSMASTAMTLF